MTGGVTLIDPEQTFVDPEVAIEKDSIIYPHVKLEGRTRIGGGSIIRSGTRVTDSKIGARTELLDSCIITNSVIGEDAVVGPASHIHNETVIGAGCRIGSFVEIENSRIGDGTRASHMSYVGDAIVGSNVDIGAGTITCSFDGNQKNVTIVQDGVFIGSSCQLVAPVTIGKNAFVAAGSYITVDVPAGAPGTARSRQTNKRRRETTIRRQKPLSQRRGSQIPEGTRWKKKV
jgi:bifunctional UDP-N-acetylglucosamine pyrophosphorylase/glucosamine-1-phosphate N-acetyltransferase